MPYKPDTNCARESELRADIARANYAGNWKEVSRLSVDLNAHRKTCPTCQGVPLYKVLWPNAVIAEVTA